MVGFWSEITFFQQILVWKSLRSLRFMTRDGSASSMWISVATCLVNPLVDVLTVKWTTSSFRMGKFVVRLFYFFHSLYDILGYLRCWSSGISSLKLIRTIINCLSAPNILTLHKLLCPINILSKKERLQFSRSWRLYVYIYIEIYRYIQYISPNQTSLHPTSPLNSQPHLSDVPALAAVRHTETGVKKMSTYQTRMLSFPRIIR